MWSVIVLLNVVTLEFVLRNLWHSPVTIAFLHVRVDRRSKPHSRDDDIISGGLC